MFDALLISFACILIALPGVLWLVNRSVIGTACIVQNWVYHDGHPAFSVKRDLVGLFVTDVHGNVLQRRGRLFTRFSAWNIQGLFTDKDLDEVIDSRGEPFQFTLHEVVREGRAAVMVQGN